MKNKVEFKYVLKEVFDILVGKCSIPIIDVLFDGTKQYKEQERTIPNINTRMLSRN